MTFDSIKSFDFIYINPKWLEKEKRTTQTYFGVFLTVLVPVLLGVYIAYIIYSNNSKPDIKDNTFYWLDYENNLKYTPVWNTDIVDLSIPPQVIQVNSVGNANICQKTMPTLAGLGYLPMCPYDNDESNVPNGIGFGVKLKPNVVNVGYNEASGVGVQGIVETVIATETDVYMIGSFAMAGNRPTANIGSYNINTGKFSILAGQPPQNAGPPGTPTSGLIYNGYLYVAGNGLNVVDTLTSVNGIARMNIQTLAWEKIGSGIPTPYLFSKFIMYQSKIYIACTTSNQPATTVFFTLVPGQTTFTQVSINGFNQNSVVTAMQTFQTELYIASVAPNGAFLYKVTSQNQATQVYSFPQQNVQSVDSAKRINVMTVVTQTTPPSSTLFFGGNIPGITGSPNNFLAGWTGTAMCSDMSICPALNLDLEAVSDPSINAIAYFSRTDINNPVLYVGGKFSAINGQAAYSITQYDTNTKRWIKLKDGGVKLDTTIPANVKSISYNSKMMYFGGVFKRTATSRANDLLNNVGAYDGFNYIQQVGTSTSNFVSTINAPYSANTELVKFYLFQTNVGTPFSIKLSEVLMNPTNTAGTNYIAVKAFNTFAIGENSYKFKDDYGTIRKGNDNNKLLYAVGVGGASGIISDCADSQYGFVGYDNTGLSFTCCYDPATNKASAPNGVPSSYTACTNSAIPDNIPIVTSIDAPVWMKKNNQYSKIADRPSEFAMFLIKTESFYSYTKISSGKDNELTILGAAAGILSTLVVMCQFLKRQAYWFDNSVEHGPKHAIYSTTPVEQADQTGNTPKSGDKQPEVQMV